MPKKKINPTKKTITLTEAEFNKIVRKHVLKATIDAIHTTQAIFFTVLCDKEGADAETMQRIWKNVENLSDSIVKKYVNVHDLIKTLATEYDIFLEK